jgi:hypothetical protein
VDEANRRFLRDLTLILGIPALLMAGLVVWWKPWNDRSPLLIASAYERREADARAAGIQEATWHELRLSVPDEYVILSRDSVVEVLEWSPQDRGKGSWSSHLAFLPITPATRQRFLAQAENCGLAPGRCWDEQVGRHRVVCQQAAGMPVPELWWTPLTVCEIDDLEVWLALNAPEERRPVLWEVARATIVRSEGSQ